MSRANDLIARAIERIKNVYGSVDVVVQRVPAPTQVAGSDIFDATLTPGTPVSITAVVLANGPAGEAQNVSSSYFGGVIVEGAEICIAAANQFAEAPAVGDTLTVGGDEKRVMDVQGVPLAPSPVVWLIGLSR